jgi:hypothetical protein
VSDFLSSTTIGGYWNTLDGIDDILKITKYGWIKGDRAEQVVCNHTGFWGACSFHLCRLRTDRCSFLLSCWMHASHLAGQIKYHSTTKLVALFGPGSTRVRVLVLMGVWQGREEWAQGQARHDSWQSGGSLGTVAPVYLATFIGIVSLVTCNSLDRWVWFVWEINHQLVRNRFESPSLLDSGSLKMHLGPCGFWCIEWQHD